MLIMLKNLTPMLFVSYNDFTGEHKTSISDLATLLNIDEIKLESFLSLILVVSSGIIFFIYLLSFQ